MYATTTCTTQFLLLNQLEKSDHAAGHGSALSKALLVLQYMSETSRPVSLADLTHEFDLPRQTLHRILQSLVQTGLAIRTVHKDKYVLGHAMVDLALNTLRNLNSGPVLRNILKELADETGETCNVGVLDHGEVLYIERVEGSSPLRLQLEVGSRVPFYCTAIGKLLVSSQHKNIRTGLYKSIALTQHTENTLVDEALLEDHFKNIRKQGYSFNHEEYVQGLTAIAVPIKDKDGNNIAGLAVHAPAVRMDFEKAQGYLMSMHDKAERIANSWNNLDPL